MSLTDRVCLVTGASRGIGKSIAAAFVAHGARVIVCSRSEPEVAGVVAELSRHGRIRGMCLDVSKAEDVAGVFRTVRGDYGGIDILVNAAAVQGPIGTLAELEVDAWVKCVNIDLMGTVFCCRAALPIMREADKGKIINFSGGGATSSRANFSAYACAKTAVVRFTETLAAEVACDHIDVNAVAPGMVRTRMLDEIVSAGPERAGTREIEQIARLSAEGAGSPKRAVGVVLYLVSPESDGVTGRLISAVWDPWDKPGFRETVLHDRSLYTLRRIDGRNFAGVAS